MGTRLIFVLALAFLAGCSPQECPRIDWKHVKELEDLQNETEWREANGYQWVKVVDMGMLEDLLREKMGLSNRPEQWTPAQKLDYERQRIKLQNETERQRFNEKGLSDLRDDSAVFNQANRLTGAFKPGYVAPWYQPEMLWRAENQYSDPEDRSGMAGVLRSMNAVDPGQDQWWREQRDLINKELQRQSGATVTKGEYERKKETFGTPEDRSPIVKRQMNNFSIRKARQVVDMVRALRSEGFSGDSILAVLGGKDAFQKIIEKASESMQGEDEDAKQVSQR